MAFKNPHNKKKARSPVAVRRPRKEKVKQGHLRGLEPVSIKAIDDAAEAYYDVMMERVKLSKEEDETKTALIEAMIGNGQTLYEYDHNGTVRQVILVSKSNVKVKKKTEVHPDALEI